MIRENYSSLSSGSSNVDLSNYVTKSELNQNVVNVIKNLDTATYSESEGLTTTISNETVNNLSNVYNDSQYSSMTNLNKWVENKIVNGSTGVYNKIKSELFLKEMNHKPISNINFCYDNQNLTTYQNENISFNTNNLVFTEIKTVSNNDTINVSKGDVIVVFFKHYISNIKDYVVDCMLIVVCGLNILSGTTISGLVDQVEYTYFKANPNYSYFTSFTSSSTAGSITVSCNADCMLTTKFTNSFITAFDNTDINYFYFWSGNDDSYIDFTNVFMTNKTNELIFKDKASSGSIGNLTGHVSDQSFYALRQRNSIQNEILNMFSDTNILNDLRLLSNLYQRYSISSIYCNSFQYFNVLTPDNTATTRTTSYQATSPSVFIALFNDLSKNPVILDLVYCPSGVKIGSPASKTISGFENFTIFNQCNNIFNTQNDLTIVCDSNVNLNRNISFTINFMNLRNSERSTHLLIKSNRCSFSSIINKLQSFQMLRIDSFDPDTLNTNCYLLDLDDWIDTKQGCIMNTPCGENIRITF